MENKNRILDFVENKKIDKNNKQLDKITTNKIDRVVIKDPIQCGKTEEEKYFHLTREKIFDRKFTKIYEEDVDSENVKSLIKKYIADKMGLEKTKFVFDDNDFYDYGIKNSEFYHIFLVLDQKKIDYNIMKDVLCRLTLSQTFLEKQKIVLFSILDNKIYIFEVNIEKNIVDFLKKLGGKNAS